MLESNGGAEYHAQNFLKTWGITIIGTQSEHPELWQLDL